MPKRIKEVDQGEEAFSDIEKAREFAEESKKRAGKMYNGFLKQLKALDVKGRYLDVGAGPGILTAIVAENFPDVHITALEVSKAMVSIAKEYINEKNLTDRVTFVVGDASDEEIMKEQGEFDLVYSTYSMHHWKEPKENIRAQLRAVKKNGTLVIYDLKRVSWLYYLPGNSGFMRSIRAAYLPEEIKGVLKKLDIDRYEIKKGFPPFMQSVIVRK